MIQCTDQACNTVSGIPHTHAAPDRPGDRDQQQAADTTTALRLLRHWNRWEIEAALAAARAEEAARWQAKIEAVLSDRDVVPRDVAIDLRALLGAGATSGPEASRPQMTAG